MKLQTLPDGQISNQKTVEVDGRKPEDPPTDEVEQPTAELETEEQPEEQTDETNS